MSEDRLSVPTDHIHVPENRLRSFNEAAGRALAMQIAKDGQLTPIIVYKSTARRDRKNFTLICGERRLWAVRHLGWETIDTTLRTAAEAPMLEIADHLAAPSADALEEGEFLQAYCLLWQKENGPIRRGGFRWSKGHNVPLADDLKYLKKSGFFNHLEDKFQISRKTAQRRLAIGRMEKVLRDRLRETGNTKDQSLLLKVASTPQAEQMGIFGALALERDLKKVLRMDDPATGRKGVGRMETGDWRMKRFQEAWDALPKDRLPAVLDGLGVMMKPIQAWPSHLPRLEVLPAKRNTSPLWWMMQNPYEDLSARLKYQQREEMKAQIAAEEDMARYKAELAIYEKINAVERERRPEYEAQRAKAKAAKSRKPKRGRPVDTPEIKFAKKLVKGGVLPDLADRLVNVLKLDRTFWITKEAHKLTEEEQREIVGRIDAGDDMGEASYRVMKMLQPRENEAD